MSQLFRAIRLFVVERLCVDMVFLRARMALFAFNLIPDFYFLSPLRNLILVMGGANIDVMCAYIRSPLWCSDLKGLQFGKGVFVNMGCRFEGTAPIIIGDRCQIGPFCCFENVNHSAAGDHALPITVGSGVWIGAKVVITPGVDIDANSIIAAGAVVTKNVSSGELWGGVPARKIKDVIN